ncbi:5619_t:CDS:2 [Ambispora leptoticha]|uniref:5619_t:CDS:1 n=1 Tax=Ambispora leptoticha TaxID=144679 RepID=A0A9N8Z683_9GLOM|nr:5619_t:CDS:2 [Ambispora leptoticha]
MNVTDTNSTNNSLSSSSHENPILENLFGYLGTFLLSIQLLPQVYKNWKGKSTKGLSATMLLIFATSSFIFGIYTIGVSLPIPIILQPQSFGLLSLVCHVQCLYYNSNKYHQKENKKEEIHIEEKRDKDENNDHFEQSEKKPTLTVTTPISDYERKLKLRNHQIKCLSIFSFWIVFFTTVQTVGALWIKRTHEKNISWPENTLGTLSLVLIFIGFLPQYYVIFRDKIVRGISFIFTCMDMIGCIFELLSLAFAPPPFNILASLVYIYIIVSWLLIIFLYYFFSWWNSRKNKEVAEENQT